MEADSLEIYEMWDAAPLAMPAHSRLFHLEPIGVGTAEVESLTSYVVRLAEMHSVRPHHLVGHEIFPLLGRPYLAEVTFPCRIGSFWCNETHVFNGTKAMARDLVTALETLTGRRELRFLTLLTWAGVFPAQQLQRRIRAYCPSCYEEWRRAEQVVYDPLLWTLTPVGACPRHQRRLRLACPYPDCGYASPWLAGRSRPGHCARCRRWLGIAASEDQSPPDMLTPEELRVQVWIANALGEVFAAAPNFPVPPRRDQMLRPLAAWIRSRPNSSKQAWAREVGIRAHSISNWERRGILPTLWNLLSVCYHLGTTPLCLLQGDEPAATQTKLETRRVALFPARPAHVHKAFDHEVIRHFLEGILTGGEQPPPSLREVARRLDRSDEVLRRHLPDLCHAISERHLQDLRAQGRRSRERVREEVRQATYEVHSQGEYPSAHRVAPLLSQPDLLRGGVAKVAWQDALQELGWLKGKTGTTHSV